MSGADALNEDPSEDGARRDRYGRYLVVTPTGDVQAYTRATTISGCTDDTSNLQSWFARMVLIGIGLKSHLYARAVTTDAENRKALNQLAEDCAEQGGANSRREMGTATHKLVERAIADPDYEVPDLFRRDVEAILAAVEANGFEIVTDWSEVMVVIDRLQIAGTCDLILRRKSDGQLFIVDLKTGALSSMAYAHLSYSCQLAIYANGDNIYRQGKAKDGSEDERLPMPPIDRDTAYIIHCEPGSGEATFYTVNLTEGRKILELSYQVHQVRKTKDLLTEGVHDVRPDSKKPITVYTPDGMTSTYADATEGEAPATDSAPAETPSKGTDGEGAASASAPPAEPAAAEEPSDPAIMDDVGMHASVVGWFLDRFAALKELGHAGRDSELARVWPEGVSRPPAVAKGDAMWDVDEFDRIEEALNRGEKIAGAPFPANDPRLAGTVVKRVADVLIHAKPEHVAELRAIVATLTPDAKERMKRWSAEAKKVGLSWAMGRGNQNILEGNYLRTFAAVMLAENYADKPEDGDDVPLALINFSQGLVPGADDAYDGTVGQVLGDLAPADVQRVIDSVVASPRLSWDADGAPIFSAPSD